MTISVGVWEIDVAVKAGAGVDVLIGEPVGVGVIVPQADKTRASAAVNLKSRFFFIYKSSLKVFHA
jgi:hypothetical protein